MTPTDLLQPVKDNLILTHDQYDDLLLRLIAAAINYAESYQHLAAGYYAEHDLPPTTEQAVIMLVSNWYESRDDSSHRRGYWTGTCAKAGTYQFLFQAAKIQPSCSTWCGRSTPTRRLSLWTRVLNSPKCASSPRGRKT